MFDYEIELTALKVVRIVFSLIKKSSTPPVQNNCEFSRNFFLFWDIFKVFLVNVVTKSGQKSPLITKRIMHSSYPESSFKIIFILHGQLCQPKNKYVFKAATKIPFISLHGVEKCLGCRRLCRQKSQDPHSTYHLGFVSVVGCSVLWRLQDQIWYLTKYFSNNLLIFLCFFSMFQNQILR